MRMGRRRFVRIGNVVEEIEEIVAVGGSNSAIREGAEMNKVT